MGENGTLSRDGMLEPVEHAILERAQAGEEQAFQALVDPYRRELQVHCYRLTGSLTDAEDLLQETLLAAWRGLPGFQQRSSLRSWLYRIATNQCLNALRAAGRRWTGRALSPAAPVLVRLRRTSDPWPAGSPTPTSPPTSTA